MLRESVRCSDVNTKYCPCLLATVNQCISCSLLAGKTECDCQWQGLCIFQARHWQKQELAANEEPPRRPEEEGQVVNWQKLSEHVWLIRVQVSPLLAQELDVPGAFAFLRSPRREDYFSFPVGVYRVRQATVEFVIEEIGPKTVALCANQPDFIYVRGPYFNGILGKPWIDNLTYGKIILVAGGIGQAPALPILQHLRRQHNEIHVLLAPGRIQSTFLAAEAEPLAAQVAVVPSLRQAGFPLLRQWLCQSFDLLVSCGPDQQHRAIIRLLEEEHYTMPLVVTNNATFCCGEGICGSCLQPADSERRLCMCKVQTDFSHIIDVEC